MTALLALESVGLAHQRDKRRSVLVDISLEARRREIVAVHGERGAGKTALLNVAGGFVRPDSGRVRFDGIDLFDCSRRQRTAVHRHRIAWMDRGGPQCQDLPIGTYVGLPLYRLSSAGKAHDRAMRVLAELGIEDCADKRWEVLSDTERALAALAHAVVRRPDLLIVDDPTAALGIVAREQVLSQLQKVADGGAAVLMAVPDMPSMLTATVVRSLSRGRLISPLDAEERERGRDRDDVVVEFPTHRRG